MYIGLLEIQQAYESSHVWAYRVVKYCPINCNWGNMLLLCHILTPNNGLKSILIFVSKYVFSRGIFINFNYILVKNHVETQVNEK